MIGPVESYEWVFTQAVTNFVLLNEAGNPFMTATQRMVILSAKAITSKSNQADVSVRIGFAPSALPAIENNSANGKRGIFVSEPGIAAGGGEVYAPGSPLITGDAGVSPMATCSEAVAGAWRLIMAFMIIDA